MNQYLEIEKNNKQELYELVHADCQKFISKEYCEFFQEFLSPLGINFPEVLINPLVEISPVEEIILPCEAEKIHSALEIMHEKFLKKKEVRFHDLKKKNETYKTNGLALIALVAYPFKFIHKDVLSKFIRAVTGNSQGDYQARHLSAQDGWNILNKNETYLGSFKTKSGFHMMNDFTVPKFGYVAGRRDDMLTSFEEIKKYYENRCATCGAKENESAPKNPNKLVSLQKGHLDPRKPLTDNNTIPQCEECNQLYKDDFVFDKTGKAVALASTKVFRNTCITVKEQCYAELSFDEKISAIRLMLEGSSSQEESKAIKKWLDDHLSSGKVC